MINVKSFTRGEKKLFKGLKIEYFLLVVMQKKKKKKPETKKKKEISNENGLLDHRRLQRLLDLKYRDINDGLVRKHFQVQDLAALLVKLRKSKYNLQKIKFS